MTETRRKSRINSKWRILSIPPLRSSFAGACFLHGGQDGREAGGPGRGRGRRGDFHGLLDSPGSRTPGRDSAPAPGGPAAPRSRGGVLTRARSSPSWGQKERRNRCTHRERARRQVRRWKDRRGGGPSGTAGVLVAASGGRGAVWGCAGGSGPETLSSGAALPAARASREAANTAPGAGKRREPRQHLPVPAQGLPNFPSRPPRSRPPPSPARPAAAAAPTCAATGTVRDGSRSRGRRGGGRSQAGSSGSRGGDWLGTRRPRRGCLLRARAGPGRGRRSPGLRGELAVPPPGPPPSPPRARHLRSAPTPRSRGRGRGPCGHLPVVRSFPGLPCRGRLSWAFRLTCGQEVARSWNSCP